MQKVSIVICFRASKHVRATPRHLHNRGGSKRSAGTVVATPAIVAVATLCAICICFIIIMFKKKSFQIDLTRSRRYHSAHEPNFALKLTNLFSIFSLEIRLKAIFFFFARLKF